MSISKKKIDSLIETVQNLYLSDDIPWMIGYSGGKDSTAALQLVWMAIENLPVEQRKKRIHTLFHRKIIVFSCKYLVINKNVENFCKRNSHCYKVFHN